MGRIRTVKPEFFLHEGLFDLEQELACPVRIAFQGLWCQADREGRFTWQPRKLKAQVCPYDELDFSRVLDALASRGFLIKYAFGSVVFGLIPSFKSHQIINNKERASAIPPHDASDVTIITCTDEARVEHAKGTRDPTRNKEQGKEQGSARTPKRFTPPTLEQVNAYCQERRNDVNPQRFIDHYESNGWKVGGKGAMKDWKASVRTWEGNQQPTGKAASSSKGPAPLSIEELEAYDPSS